jgi:hypothetical protein
MFVMKSRLMIGVAAFTALSTQVFAMGKCPLPVVVNPCVGLTTDSIANGSFESLNNTVGFENGIVQTKLVATKYWDWYHTVNNWTSVDGAGIELWGGGFNGVTPTQGNVLMELKGSQPNTIAQDFCTTQGRKSLNLDTYARTGLFGDNVVNVTIDGVQVMHIDPAHQFFKTYGTCIDFSKGKHHIQLSSEAGTNPSEGGLVDNIRLDLDNCASVARSDVGVTTVLMALSEIDSASALSIITNSMNFVKPVRNPKVLYVRSIYNEGEGLGDFTVIPQMLTQLKYDVTAIDEPQAGLTLTNTSGYDVVWFNNPGYPEQSAVTLETLYTIANNQSAGVVLSGDDMSVTDYVNMSELTMLTYGNNGTSACNQNIDNNATTAKYVVSYKGKNFTYGDDIDQDTVIGKSTHRIHQCGLKNGVQTFATAKTNITGCSLAIPAIVGYRVPKNPANGNYSTY